MKRNVFEVPKWHVIQHREQRALPLPSASDSPLRCLEDELYEHLYSGGCDRLPESETNSTVRAWADRIHASCEELPSFGRLAAECRGDPAAAAAAVEALLDELRDLLAPAAPFSPARPGSSKDPLRRPFASACVAASRAIEELRDAMEGLSAVALGAGTGNEIGRPGDGARAKPLAALLREDDRLRRIALLAGRMKRIAASKRRSRVKHGTDELADIEQGAELARALPAELAKLTDRRRRLDFLRSILERQVLQYQLTGSETLGRGPLVVLLDKSGSMEQGDGTKDVWATALALALLEHAHVERRAFALIDYNAQPFYEQIVRPGEALPHDALFVGCSGGTSIAAAVSRGLELVHTARGALRRGDLVLVSDGIDEATGDAPALRAQAAALDVSIFGLAIGMPGNVLGPWCDEAHGITDLSTVEGEVAGALFS